MSDYMVRGTACDGELRFFAALTTETAEFARNAHNLSPIATAALGRLLTAGTMMGPMMKGDDDLLTLKIDCEGPIKGITVTADSKGNVRGYVKNPDVILPATPAGKLNVADALGLGVLSVIRDVGLKEPYVGQTILETSEIAEDLTYYFANSEQTPSSVALGVLMNRENTVRRAGGFILQVMPGFSDETAAALEKRLSEIPSVTTMLDQGLLPEDIMNRILEGMSPVFQEKIPVGFRCNCSREHTADMLGSLSRKELQEMIDEDKDIEVKCNFCGKAYTFSVDELRAMLEA